MVCYPEGTRAMAMTSMIFTPVVRSAPEREANQHGHLPEVEDLIDEQRDPHRRVSGQEPNGGDRKSAMRILASPTNGNPLDLRGSVP